MNQQPASIEGIHDNGNNEPPVRIHPWPTYDKGDVTTDQADANAAFSAVTSRRLFRYDTRPLCETETGQLEAEIANYFSVDYALATTSGTSAIALCLLGLGVGPGDEVLVSCFGFPATPSAIILTGATPVLVSVDEELHMDLQEAQQKITPRTKAILMIHMRGQTGDVRAAAALCERNGIHLVEDAVPVLGLKVGGKLAGTFGAAAAFSTQSDKSLNTGEGGFLITNDPLIYQRAVVMCGAYEGRIRKHVLNDEPIIDEFSYPLFNFRMDEIRAAIARVQLSRLPSRDRKSVV